MHFLLVPAGAALGGLIGFVTSPSYLGIQPPLSILSSRHPTDAFAKAELLNHLRNYATAGAVAGSILFLVAHAIITSAPKPR